MTHPLDRLSESRPQAFGGIPIQVSVNATECCDLMVLFNKPNTKRRRRRMRGKYGRLVYDKPVAFQTPRGLVMHPVLFEELKRRLGQ